MKLQHLLLLVVLAAIWGASFLFLRIAVPYLGPVFLIELRMILAAVFLFAVALYLGKPLRLRDNWRHYFILGLSNSAIPFLLLAYAAQTLTASLLSIFIATTPIWGVLIASLCTKTPLSFKRLIGLGFGVIGVYLLVGFDPVASQEGASIAIAAALVATFSYGATSVYAQYAQQADVFANAHGSMWASALVIIPLLPFFPSTQLQAPVEIWFAVVALGVLCSGVAFLLYFQLIKDVGAIPATTVTYLIPLFGILWGALFLDEAVGWHTLLGAAVVLVGTALVSNFSIRTALGIRGAV